MHDVKCFRSDGDWFCTPWCKHDAEQEQRETLEAVTRERDEARADLDLAYAHGVNTDGVRALMTALGMREAKHTADGVARAACDRIAELECERDEARGALADQEADYNKSRRDLWAQAKSDRNRIAELEAVLAAAREIAERIPCRVARPGEGTCECRVESVCDCCETRSELQRALDAAEEKRGIVAEVEMGPPLRFEGRGDFEEDDDA